MGIFRREQPKPAPTSDGPLDERVRALESRVRQLDADFDDLFDRFTRLQGRRVKREARAELEVTPEEAINAAIRAQRGGNPFRKEN